MGGERILICHSLACLLWLLHARAGGDAADRVLLVAPPCTDEIEAVVRFRADGVTAEQVRAAARTTRMLCSDADPYCPAGPASTFGDPLELDYEVLPGTGHLNPDAGFGPWPEVEAWALSDRAPS
jgi:predicted alpha/beta hydrolase family esterase